MASPSKAFLVVKAPEGLGEVFPLQGGQRYVLGRAQTNEIVLHDNVCSRQHAEVSLSGGRWRIRDCGSLNGSRVNDETVTGDRALTPGDEIEVGHSRLIFVENLDQLPPVTVTPPIHADGVSIKKRLGQTRYELLTPKKESLEETPPPFDRHRLSRDLSLLYRLALDMGSSTTYEQLVNVVLSGLLEGTPADTGAVLTVRPGGELEVTAQVSKSNRAPYARVSEFIAKEVIQSKEAILAEDASRSRYLREQGPSRNNGIYSLICAPVPVGERVKALIHLYCTDPMKVLDSEDLEFTVAVGKQLAVAMQGLQRQMELYEENQRLKAQVTAEVQLVGNSPAIREIETQINRVGGTNAIVLIRGESGVGKELVARAIHLASPRRHGPFVCLNCAALAESLLESELFGHEKGSFTGATERKIGKFEAAHNGTIFLDEIGELNPSAQAKLLRILEGHPYERVGGHEPIRVNVRVVAATNRPLEDAVHAGQFRRDLYFRLHVVEMRVPPLSERRGDIALLSEYFLQRFLQETGRKIRGFTPSAMEKLQAYDWPGNVRELRNVIERAVVLGTGVVINAEDIALSTLQSLAPAAATDETVFHPKTLEDWEKLHIQATLRHTAWNKSQAAQILGIERSTLDRKIKSYDLHR